MESSHYASDVRKQIEIRMIELNKEQLAKIASYDELLKRWESSSSGSDVRKQIEIRMIELVIKMMLFQLRNAPTM